MILENTENDVAYVTEKLIESSHRISLVIEENKTKYLIISRHVVKKVKKFKSFKKSSLKVPSERV